MYIVCVCFMRSETKAATDPSSAAIGEGGEGRGLIIKRKIVKHIVRRSPFDFSKSVFFFFSFNSIKCVELVLCAGHAQVVTNILITVIVRGSA